MSQHNQVYVKQLEKWLIAMQAQIQALTERGIVRIGAAAAMSTEVVKPQTFDRTLSKISGFVTACKLYIRMKMREVAVEEQIQ